MIQFGIRQLALPHIGCGMDRLKWENVLPIIRYVFSDVPDINIKY